MDTTLTKNENKSCDISSSCSSCPLSQGQCCPILKNEKEEKKQGYKFKKTELKKDNKPKTALKKKPKNFYLKKYNIQKIQKFSWVIVPLISLAGLWYHKLGLIMPVMMVFILGISYFRGRVWCGNFCPRGAFLDIFIKPLSLHGKIPSIFKSKYFRFLVVAVFMTVFSLRTKAAFSGWSTMEGLDRWGLVFAVLCLVTTIIAIIVGVIFSARTWCSFCPMGTFQKALYNLNKKINKKV